MSNFRPINRDTGFLLPPSVDEWLPQRHLARFVVEVIDGLDLSALVKAYRGSGSASYHPAMLLSLLVYGYATKVFSSRAIERATYDSVAFRKRFLVQIELLFVDVLKLAHAMGMLKLGTVAVDGTKLHANASRHSALSYGHAQKIEQQLRKEVQQFRRLAERADAADIPDGMSIPAELERGELRLAAIAEAKAKIEARDEARLTQEQAEHQAKLAARAEQAQRTGKKPGGRPPAPPTGGVRASDQINLTDEESRIMRVAGNAFEQCYNAQAAVAVGSLLVVAHNVTKAGNDKQQLVPMIAKLKALPKELGRVRRALADNGFQSGQRRAVRSGQNRTADRHGPRATSCGLEAALCGGTESTAPIRHAAGEDGVPPQDPARPKALCAAQADPGAGVRHHQVRDGLSPDVVTRPR